jgi:predicted amidophosphoribosyltransferase
VTGGPTDRRGALPAVAFCQVCARALAPGEERCRNPLCASAARWFRWNVAVARRGGLLEAALDAYKYGGEVGVAPHLVATLARFLERRATLLDRFDLVVASPTYVGPGGRSFDHVRALLVQAARRLGPAAAGRIDLAPVAAVVKTGPTPRLAGRGHEERRRIAQMEIRPRLAVPDPGRTAGRRILVFDDVFTDGRTLDEVARALRLRGGAREVCGISLCRQPWRGERGVPPKRGLGC